VVVVGVHWSYDFQREPSQRQERLARRLVALGADILFGTGPHVLQRVDRLSSPRGDALVAYSLGNLISNQGMRYRPGREPPTSHFPMLDPASRDNVLLRVAVRIGDGARVVIERAEAVPLWTENNFWARELEETERMDIRLVALADTPPEVGVERRAAIRNALGPVVELASR